MNFGEKKQEVLDESEKNRRGSNNSSLSPVHFNHLVSIKDISFLICTDSASILYLFIIHLKLLLFYILMDWIALVFFVFVLVQ